MLRLLLLAGALSALAMAQSLPERAAQVLAANCTSCHGGNLRVSELDLRTRDAMAKGGTRGPALVVGKA
ncbi:MAG: c-type cytochrome domain-containing protein, partial [Acidobacteriota bacterium]